VLAPQKGLPKRDIVERRLSQIQYYTIFDFILQNTTRHTSEYGRIDKK